MGQGRTGKEMENFLESQTLKIQPTVPDLKVKLRKNRLVVLSGKCYKSITQILIKQVTNTQIAVCQGK